MALGTLGQSAPSSATNTLVYTVTAGTTATISINVCNRGSSSGTFRLAISDTNTPDNKDYVYYDSTVAAQTTLRIPGIVMSSGKRLIVYCSTANFSINVYGFEE